MGSLCRNCWMSRSQSFENRYKDHFSTVWTPSSGISRRRLSDLLCSCRDCLRLWSSIHQSNQMRKASSQIIWCYVFWISLQVFLGAPASHNSLLFPFPLIFWVFHSPMLSELSTSSTFLLDEKMFHEWPSFPLLTPRMWSFGEPSLCTWRKTPPWKPFLLQSVLCSIGFPRMILPARCWFRSECGHLVQWISKLLTFRKASVRWMT